MFSINFSVHDVPFSINTAGKHNMENAIAAVAVAHGIGVPLDTCAAALKN